ncbi:MAG: CPBP family intramembrane glutamic endopeptidase, partial [Lentilactobacillus diolivorans]|uniref:CPBP family intramembrane glutamic endopeptidase n=1 Tax=Lentilactobacillus diolivorans TaxID=179838 RepID=UPI0039EB2752
DLLSGNAVNLPLALSAGIAADLLSGNAVNLPLALSAGIGAGLFEEYLFRGVIMGLLLKVFGRFSKGRQIWYAILVSSLLFGIAHGINATAQPLMYTLEQMASAGLSAPLYAAVYLRSGTIIMPMLFHGIWDFGTSLSTANVVVTANMSGQDFLIEIGTDLITLVIALYYLRSKKLKLIDTKRFE